MDVKEYILSQVEKTRDTMRSDSFSHMGELTLSLRGKKLSSVLSILSSSPKAAVELIDPALISADSPDFAEGEIVSAAHAFRADDPVVFSDGKVFFASEDGSLFTPDEYAYLKENTLVERAVFGKSLHASYSLAAAFKRICRTAAEARADKAKDILYLTAGAVRWTDKKKSTKTHINRSTAPLFTMHIEPAGRGLLAFCATGAGVYFRINTVFRRDLISQYGADIFDGLSDLPYAPEDLLAALDTVEKNAEALLGNRVTVEKDAVYITLLDSQYEAICQKIERNIDALALSPLARLLAGEKTEEAPQKETSLPVIYPLAADESQREVICASLSGKSVFASAPAGTGKSQTAVNIAANTVLRGGNLLVLSEKLAANEVFLNYSARIGLDAFCLTVDSAMTLDSLIRAVERVAALPARYVKTDAALECVENYRRAVLAYDNLTAKTYAPIKGMKDTSLYELISLAASYPPSEQSFDISVKSEDYGAVLSLLRDLDVGIFTHMREEEYRSFFSENGTSQDAELDLLLNGVLERLEEKGLKCKDMLTKSGVERRDAMSFLRAETARHVAKQRVTEVGLDGFGEWGVKKLYGSLLDAWERMQALYAAALTQTLSMRAKESSVQSLLSRLSDAKKAKISVSDFFRENAQELREVFPIVVSTPMPAVNYLYGTGLDSFTVMSVDEASQMPAVAVLPFLDRVERLVVFGDEKQLAIVNTFAKSDKSVTEDYEEKIFSAKTSVLDAVRGKENAEGFFAGALRYHYRSKTEMLVHVSNENCYNNSLQVVPDAFTAREFLPSDMGLSLIEVADRARPPFILRDGTNLTEANAIVGEVYQTRASYPDRSIGIITLNEKQQNLILDKLEEAHIETGKTLWVRSLDNAQGKEADFIFISIAHAERKENGDIRLNISTFNREGGENRMNVLFTRAAYRAYVYISFDYKELLKSDNPRIRLLYEYLRYAKEGKLNARPAASSPPADEALVNAVSSLVPKLLPLAEGHARIGSEAVSVDIAVKKRGAERYALGLIMPSFGQSAVAAVTKLSVLKQAQWKLLPLSPAYFLAHPDRFAEQFEKSLCEEREEKTLEPSSFLTARRPKELFTLASFTDKLYEETPLTAQELVSLRLEDVYRPLLRKGLFTMDERELLRLNTSGDKEARLASFVRYLPYYVQEKKHLSILNGVNSLYVVGKEKRAGLLLAALLRSTPDASSAATLHVIRNLLSEAKELGLG